MGTSLGLLYAELALKTSEFEKGILTSKKLAEKLQSDVDDIVESINAKLENIGKSLSVGVTLPLTLLGKAAVDTFRDFEQSMRNTFSVMSATDSEMEALRKKAEDMGATTRFSASQAADALYSLGSAGQNATEAMNSLDGVLQLAGATGSDLAFTSSTIASTLSQFHLQADKASHIADVFSLAISKSQANMTKLSYSMKYVGPVAAGLGVSLETSTAALMRLYNTGFGGEQAGTILRSGLQKLASGTEDVKKKLQALGVSYDEVNPKTNNLADIIERLKDANIDVAASSDLFGEAAAAGMQALIEGGGDALRTMDRLLQASDGAAKSMQDIQNASSANTQAELASAWEAVQITLTSNVIPAVDTFAKGITNVLQVINALPVGVQTTGTALFALAAAAGPLLLVAIGIKKIKKEMAELNLVMKANPVLAWGATIAAAGAIALGIIAQVKKAHEDAMKHAERQLEQAKSIASDAVKNGEKGRSIQDLLGKYDSLKGKIHDSKEAQSQFNSVVQQLKAVIPDAQGTLQAHGDGMEQFVAKARKAAREALELEKTQNERALLLSHHAAKEAQKYVDENESKLEHSFKRYSQDLYRTNEYEHIFEQFKTARLQGDKEKQAAIAELKKIEHWIKKDAGEGFSFASFEDAFASLEIVVKQNTTKLAKDGKSLQEQQRLLDEQKKIVAESNELKLKIETGDAALKQIDKKEETQTKAHALDALQKKWEAFKTSGIKAVQERKKIEGEAFDENKEYYEFLKTEIKHVAELQNIVDENGNKIKLSSQDLLEFIKLRDEFNKRQQKSGSYKTEKEQDTSYHAQIEVLDRFYKEKIAKAKEYGHNALVVEKEYQQKRRALIDRFIQEEDKKKGLGKGISVETKAATKDHAGSGVTLGDELTKTMLMGDGFGRYLGQNRELQEALYKTQEEIEKTKALLEGEKGAVSSKEAGQAQRYLKELQEQADDLALRLIGAKSTATDIDSAFKNVERGGKSKFELKLIDIEAEKTKLNKIVDDAEKAGIKTADEIQKAREAIKKNTDEQKKQATAEAANVYVQGAINSANALTRVIADAIEQGGIDGFAALEASGNILEQIGNMVGEPITQMVLQSVNAAIGIISSILKAINAASAKAFEKEVKAIVESSKETADEAAQKIIRNIHKSIVEQGQAPMKEAASSLLQAITGGFESGDFSNFSKTMNNIFKKMVVEKMVMFSGLQGAIEKLVNSMFSGFQGSGEQRIAALNAEKKALEKERKGTEKEYAAYQKLLEKKKYLQAQQAIGMWGNRGRDDGYIFWTDKDFAKAYENLDAELAKLGKSKEIYEKTMQEIKKIDEKIKAINPNEKADLTQIKKMDPKEIERLIKEYGEPIKAVFKLLGIEVGEGFQKALSDSMSNALTTALGEAAYTADWGSFKKAFASEMKKAIIQVALENAGMKKKVEAIISRIMKDGKITEDEITSTINELKGFHDQLESSMAGLAKITKALEGGVEVKTKTSGSIIQQLSGADRNYFKDLFTEMFSTFKQHIELKETTIQHIAATQLIINSITYNAYNSTIYITATEKTDVRALLAELVKEALAG